MKFAPAKCSPGRLRHGQVFLPLLSGHSYIHSLTCTWVDTALGCVDEDPKCLVRASVSEER